MKTRDRSLLGQIERGVLDERTSVTSLLQKCVVLGGRAGSEELRDWARRELRGYEGNDDLPQYRKVPAIIALDGLVFNGQVKGEQISRYDLPEVAQTPSVTKFRSAMGLLTSSTWQRATRATSSSPFPDRLS